MIQISFSSLWLNGASAWYIIFGLKLQYIFLWKNWNVTLWCAFYLVQNMIAYNWSPLIWNENMTGWLALCYLFMFENLLWPRQLFVSIPCVAIDHSLKCCFPTRIEVSKHLVLYFLNQDLHTWSSERTSIINPTSNFPVAVSSICGVSRFRDMQFLESTWTKGENKLQSTLNVLMCLFFHSRHMPSSN